MMVCSGPQCYYGYARHGAPIFVRPTPSRSSNPAKLMETPQRSDPGKNNAVSVLPHRKESRFGAAISNPRCGAHIETPPRSNS